MKKTLLSITVILAGLFANAQTIYVASDAIGLNDGSSWLNAFTNLQEAINSAQPGQEVWVKTGTYKPSINYTGNLPTDTTEFSFWPKNGVSVLGGFTGTEILASQRDPYNNKAVLEGQISPSRRALHVITTPSGLDTTALFDGFIVQNGFSNTSGGGAYITSGSPTFVNITFLNNVANHHGGGVHTSNSNSVFVNCRFEGNETLLYDGGAGNFQNSNVKLYNCVMYNNEANRFGGVFTAVSANVTVQNATMANNIGGNNLFQSSNLGGGPWMIAVNQSILWGNSAPNVTGIQAGASVSFTECLSQYAGNYIVADPLFTDLGNGDLSLTDLSPAIDTLSANPENNYYDPAGGFRIVGTSTDLGAYEYQDIATAINEINKQKIGVAPNPATNFITVTSNKRVNSIMVYDITGSLIEQVNNSKTINVAHYNSGIYFLVVNTDSTTETIKVIKQ